MSKVDRHPLARFHGGTAALLIFALAGCDTTPAHPAVIVLPVDVARARDAGGSSIITAVGTVARRREADLAFRLPGTLTRLDVDVGDRVARGQILGRLDPTEMAARLSAATSDVERAERTAQRYRKLAETGAIARSLYEDQRTEVDQMRAAQERTAFDWRSTTLAAPVSGIVLQRIGQAGETVAAGQAVLRVADERSALIIRLPLAPRDAARVRIGTLGSVRFDALPEPLTARVSRIGRQASATTGTLDVEMTLQESRGVESGMVGTVVLSGSGDKQAAGAVRIPSEALILAANGTAAIFTVDGGTRAKLRRVRLLRFDGEDAIIFGLGANAPVITAGAGYVKDGQPVLVSGSGG